MKRFATMFAAVGLLATTSFAGVVTFEPVVPGSDVQNINDLQPVDYNVFIAPDAAGDFAGVIDAYNVIFGTNDPDLGLGFAYSGDFTDNASFVFDIITPVGLYVTDVFAGGLYPGSDASGPGFLFGVLTVSIPGTTAAGELLGDHRFQVNSDDDFGSSSIGNGDAVENLAGTGLLRVTPEPATLMLLGLGAVGLVRRRFA